MEKCVCEKITDTLKSNNFIKDCQHGFQDKCSCVTQLLETFEDWTTSLDEETSVDAIYMDFSKAFDKVPHRRLLLKARNAGVDGNVLRWLESFFIGRRQRVILRNGLSSWKSVTSGVPQGSILGPTLFLIYVNDLPDQICSTAKMFADDTKLYRNIISVEDCQDLKNDLDSLSKWC